MIPRRASRLGFIALVCALGLVSSACKRSGPSDPPGLPLGTAGGDTSADAKVAGLWIESLRNVDAGRVAAQARYPFDFRDTRAAGQKGRCESGVLGDARAMTGVSSCLVADRLLKEDLAANPAPRIVAMSKETLPPWASAWASSVAPGWRLMSAFIHGNTSAFELIVLVGDDGVHGFWQNVSIDPA
jgi:hypothetical protein